MLAPAFEDEIGINEGYVTQSGMNHKTQQEL